MSCYYREKIETLVESINSFKGFGIEYKFSTKEEAIRRRAVKEGNIYKKLNLMFKYNRIRDTEMHF